MGATVEIKDARTRIDALEREMARHPQVELTIRHYFASGLYAREMLVPKGVLMSGLVHRTETIGIMVRGQMLIFGDDGVRVKVKAPHTHVGKPGTKRVGYAIEDVVWTTLHRTDLTNLADIEKEQFFITDDSINMFDFVTGKVRPTSALDVHDFHRMLTEFNFNPEMVRAQSENEFDRVDIDLVKAGVEIRKSDIEGMGVFPTRSFNAGDIIGPSRVGGMRTQLGRYVNHSHNPNAKMVMMLNGSAVLQMVRSVTTEEITTDYRHTLALSGIAPTGNGGMKCPV